MKVAFYGDSIVTGWRGISSPDRRWTTIVCSQLGWHELNFAVNGLGFVRWRGPDKAHTGLPLGILADVLSSDADACVVALGGNDSVIVAEMTSDVEHAIDRDLTVLVERFGHEHLVVMDLYSTFSGPYPPGWSTVRGLLRTAARRHGLSLTPGLTDTIRMNLSMLCPDEVHPNDLGHAALGRTAAPHLRSALAGQSSTN